MNVFLKSCFSFYVPVPVYHVESQPFSLAPLPFMVIILDFYGKFTGIDLLQEMYRITTYIRWGGGG